MLRSLVCNKKPFCSSLKNNRLVTQLYSTKDSQDGNKGTPQPTDSKNENLQNPFEEYDDIAQKLPPPKHHMKNAVNILKRDFKNFKSMLSSWCTKDPVPQPEEYFPSRCDILIIGGGAIGSSVAYWLKQKVHRKEMKVVVVERDPTYAKASTTLSVGGLRQQFSLEENIEMSLFGAEFMRNINEYLWIEGEPEIDVNFHPYGYLMLASEQSAEQLIANSKLQNSMGAKNVILNKSKLNRMFPWLNTNGIEAGCLGVEKEGWFDPWSFLCALKRKAVNLGAQYVHGEVKGFTYRKIPGTFIPGVDFKDYQTLHEAVVQTPDGEYKPIAFAICVNAAGAFSGDIADMARVGRGKGVLSVPLPVEPRKRYVYCFHCPNGPGLNTPLTVDPTGTYFRREGLAGHYIAGKGPDLQDEPSVDNLDVDHEYFDTHVWPPLADRVKGFDNLKVTSSWAGYYEYNTFDRNGIIGSHPYYYNFYFATGFSGHGIQQSPAVGRAIAELIIESKFLTIDLTRLGFDRFVSLEPMREINIV